MPSPMLARSFVVTVAMTGCANAVPDSSPPPPETVTIEPVVASAAPSATAAEIATPGSSSASAPPPAPPAETYGRVSKHGDKCLWHYTDASCEPRVRCNPPPPQPIVCPAGIDDADLQNVRRRRSDGVCIHLEPPAAVRCTSGMPCNPPPPRRTEIACPDE